MNIHLPCGWSQEELTGTHHIDTGRNRPGIRFEDDISSDPMIIRSVQNHSQTGCIKQNGLGSLYHQTSAGTDLDGSLEGHLSTGLYRDVSVHDQITMEGHVAGIFNGQGLNIRICVER